MKNLIAIIGPDGSGKTTLANLIKLEIEKNTDLKIENLASNFEILPTFTQIKSLFSLQRTGREKKEGYQGYHSGMQHKPNGLIKGSIICVWYSLDLILGRFRILKAKKNKTILCFARYFYDYYFLISSSKVPRGLLRVLEILIPKPDYIFCINRSAQDIYSIKPELTLEEISRQQDVIKKLSATRNNFVLINGSEGPEKTVNNILEILLNGK